jgi:hypothetical protein
LKWKERWNWGKLLLEFVFITIIQQFWHYGAPSGWKIRDFNKSMCKRHKRIRMEFFFFFFSFSADHYTHWTLHLIKNLSGIRQLLPRLYGNGNIWNSHLLLRSMKQTEHDLQGDFLILFCLLFHIAYGNNSKKK